MDNGNSQSSGIGGMRFAVFCCCYLLIIYQLSLLGFMLSCGGGSDGTTISAPSVAEVRFLPWLTNPVFEDTSEGNTGTAGDDSGTADDTGTSDASEEGARDSSLVTPAPRMLSGIRISSEINNVFGEDNSLGACLMYSAVRRFYIYAAHADAFFCLMQEIIDGADLAFEAYDGEEHPLTRNTQAIMTFIIVRTKPPR